MQAVAQQTGVPPDTLRSWERRHGFPAPSRTDSNRRLYSERDIAAITWVRDQTERGQGTNEAIAMLHRHLAGGEAAGGGGT
ncbi:MAG TPA: MerR family transcriptional regulator, partial [Thermomicrobiales bacterium]|nr:MerR family transcriptional regulator [Thermomicrobiales bacterium]